MTHSEQLWDEYERCSKVMKSFPRGAMGLTPDATKATEEWKRAKQDFTRAFSALREFNRVQSPNRGQHPAVVPDRQA